MASRKHSPTDEQLSLTFSAAEEWRDVPGYEGLYQVSNLGRVRSLDRVVRHSRNASITRLRRGKILRPAHNSYLTVILYKDKHEKNALVHVLVLESFVSIRPLGLVANHIDGHKHNNILSNLEWITQQENAMHAIEKGLTPIGKQRSTAKANEAQVNKIRHLFASGVRFARLSEQFGLTRETIRDIVRRRSWKHVP